MKKKMISLMLLLALCLGGCSAAKSAAPTPAPETPAPTSIPETDGQVPAAPAETDPAPAQEEEGEDALPETYRELIDLVTEGVRSGWQKPTLAEVDVSEVFGREGHEKLGWLATDINGDGTPELLFGEDGKDGEPGPAYDIYTLLNGQLVHPARGWELNRWFVTGSGVLVLEDGTSGATLRIAYGFFNGKLVEGFRAGDRGEYLNLHFQPFTD